MKRCLCWLLVLCLCFPLTACDGLVPVEEAGELQKFSEYAFDYFDTATTISGYEKTKEDFDRVADEILRQLGEYHQLYNIYLRYDGMDNLCTINELVNSEHRTVVVDRRIIDMLLYAREMYDKTGGMTNVAMGSVLKLWHDHRTVGTDDPTKATIPSMEALRGASQHTAIDGMVIDRAAGTVTLTDPQMR